jgi:hypothetical protein
MAELFVNFWLLSGLSLASAPIIIHLLNKRRFKVHDWAAMDFLFQAAIRNRRRLKIEDLILLLLRVLLIAALVFAVARPILKGLAGWREDERLVILDNSFSMELAGPAGRVFDAARESAVNQVQDAVGGSLPVSVWMGASPRTQARRVAGGVRGGLASAGDGSAPDPALEAAEAGSDLLKAVREAETSDLPLRLADAIQRLGDAIDAERAPRLRAVVLISDFRRGDWLESDRLREPLEAAFADLSRQGLLERLRFQFVDVGGSGDENLAVSGFSLLSDLPLAGVPLKISVEVRNFGSIARERVEGEIEIGAPGEPAFTPLKRVPLPLIATVPAGGTAAVEVQHVFEKAGEYPLRLRLENDRLARDDEGYLVASVRDGVRVAVVDGDPRPERFAGESGYLLAALAPRGGAPSGIIASRLDGEVGAAALKDADVVMVLNRQSLGPAERDVLEAFVRGGGGLAFFLGNRVEAASYAALAEPPAGRETALSLFPATLGKTRGAAAAEGRARWKVPSYDHPGFALFRGVEGGSLEQVLFSQYFELSPLSGAQVAAHYDDAAATPAVIESSAGKGRIAVFNTSADRDWSDWPTDPSYPIVLQEWTRHLAPRRSGARHLEAGEPLEWEVTPGMEYEVVTSSGRKVAIELPRGEGGGIERTASFEETEIAGFYFLASRPRPGTAAGAEGPPPLRAFAVRRSVLESDLEPAGEARLRQALAPSGVDFAFGSDIEVDAFRREQEGEVWRWLAFLAGALLLLELYLAWWFGRR